jgi:hypothetical protein
VICVLETCVGRAAPAAGPTHHRDIQKGCVVLASASAVYLFPAFDKDP